VEIVCFASFGAARTVTAASAFTDGSSISDIARTAANATIAFLILIILFI
jgi:hypothetical protein